MVYCGKPSKSCAPCRKTRTKCDLAKPACSQCVRKSRTCSGYRDTSSLMFRDHTKDFPAPQSHLISENPIASEVSDANLSVAPLKDQVSILPGESRMKPAGKALSPRLSLSIPTRQQAIYYFFSNYVWDDACQFCNFMSYLPNVYNDQAVDSALEDTIVALGLVGLGNTRKSTLALNAAHVNYVRALSAINSKLGNTSDAKSDQALVTVLLLGMYEQNTCRSSQSMRAWIKHINGAVSLLHLRGLEQLQTTVGLQVFLQLRYQVINCCMRRQVPIPDHILEWTKAAYQYQHPMAQLNTQFADIIIRFCNLRASLHNLDYSTTCSKLALSWALSIDREFIQWAASCPVFGRGRTIKLTEPNDSVFSNYFYIYPNMSTSLVWNNYSCIRILVNNIIHKQHAYMLKDSSSYSESMEHFSLDETKRIQASESVIHELTSDICASVPYYFDYHKIQAGQIPPHTIPKALHGEFLLWPLRAAAAVDVISDEMRWWIIGRLKKIVEVMGVRQAGAIAYELQSRGHAIVTWSEKRNTTLVTEQGA